LSSSSSLLPRFDGGGLLDAISSFSRWPKICSGESRGGRRCEEKMISLWKKQGKAGEGDCARELYWQDAKPSGASAPIHYSITASMCHSIVHQAPFWTQNHSLPPPAQFRGDQPCGGNGGGCSVEKGWLRISLFCSEHCRLRCEMVKFTQSIGTGNQ
jgi:hypothetical protein